MKEINYKKRIAAYLTSIGMDKKYEGKGCYAIYINNKLVYIGSSNNLFNRLVMHLYNIDFPSKARDKHKYEIFKEAHNKGYNIKFDVIYKCIDDSYKEQEKILIGEHLPPLNYITYTGHNNTKAKVITLDELIS